MTIGHTREILTARGFQLKKHARNELCGPCPWCGGTDRFIYKIDQDRYWCRQCEKNGDAIQLLRDLDGLSFQEAKKALGDNGNSARPPQSRPQNRQRRTQEGQDHSLTSGVKSSMAATYDYTDPDGRLIYQVCRFEPGEEGRKKDFKQRRPGKKEDEWIWNLKNTELMLYRLPDITKSSWVFLLEGEKDVDLAHELKIKATTNSGGANKLKGQQNKHQVMDALKGKAVYIIPDNDESGFKHAEQAAELLHGIAREIRIVKIPDQKPKGDFTDYVNKIGRDHVREELQSITEDAPVWKPPKTPPTATEDTAVKKNFPLTDLGNAERFIRDHGQDASFCWPHNRWLVWDGRRFGQDNAGVVKRKAKVTIRNIMNEAAKERDDDRAKELFKHALKSESEFRLNSMVSLARMDVSILPAEMDQNPYLLNVENGTINLKSGELRPHCRGDQITKLAHITYDPKAVCPTWESFLARITQSRLGLIQFLQRAIGYALTGQILEQVFFILYGAGANGKTVFVEAIRALLGDYSLQADFSTFLAKRNDSGASNDLAALQGARFVCASESGAGRSLNESLIKNATGGEALRARFLYGEFFEFYPTFKLFLATNHKPQIRGTDLGIWRRVRLIPFDVTIPPEEQDPSLLDKLKDELSGILNWAIRGCLDWQASGLAEPEEVKTATSDYKQDMNLLAPFLDDQCEIDPSKTVQTSDIKSAYLKWCERNGEKPLSNRRFADYLRAKGCEDDRNRQGRFWRGVGLKA